MMKTFVTNETLWNTDFAANEKLALLKNVEGDKLALKNGNNGRGSCWMQDVSASDARSVKAWLSGRGDCRVLVWRMKDFLSKLTCRQQESVADSSVSRAGKGRHWTWQLDWTMAPSSVEQSPES